MTSATDQTGRGCDLSSAVALLRDLPERGLVRGQLGAIVEPLDEATALVDSGDDEGRAYAIVPCSREASLILRTAQAPRFLVPDREQALGRADRKASRANFHVGQARPQAAKPRRDASARVQTGVSP